MFRMMVGLAAGLTLAATSAIAQAPDAKSDAPKVKAKAKAASYEKKARAFLESLTEDGVDDKKVAQLKALLEKQLATGKTGANDDFIGEALLRVYSDYRKAMRSWLRQYHDKAAKRLMQVSADADNDYLLAHANYFLARADLQRGLFEKAEKNLADLAKHELDFFHRDYEVVFYLGLAQGQLLKREQALKTFARFGKEHGDAPERYRILANKIASELKVRGENELYDLADRMTLVERFLSKKHSGKPTQAKQKEIVEILDRLIKLAEEQEKSGT